MTQAPPKKRKIPDDEIVARVKSGRTFMAPFARRDRASCRKFLDPTDSSFAVMNEQGQDNAGPPVDNPEGMHNPMMVNILVKVASVGMHDPDWHVECADPATMGIQFPGDPAELVTKLFTELWRHMFWSREFQTALIKRYVSGMGFIVALWNEPTGPVLEQVHSWDMSFDPHVKDWRKSRWAARTIHIPHDEAVERYGKQHFSDGEEDSFAEAENNDEYPKDSLELHIYWDIDEEIVIYGDEVLVRGPNRYGRIPMLVHLGDINPRNQFPLGDFALGTGLQSMFTAALELLTNQAKHGGGQGWYRPEAFEKADQDALHDSRPQGFVAVQGMRGEEAMGFTPSEAMNPAVLETLHLMQQFIDSLQGVSEFQRGVRDQGVKFATEAALLANQGGARGTQAKLEYEQFLEEAAWTVLDMLIRFGNPQAENEWLLHEALLLVTNIQVHEGSTTFKDPAVEQQSLLQLWQALAPAAPAIGLNLQELAIKLLKAFGWHDAQRMFLSPEQLAVQQQQAAMQGQPQPGQGQGAAPQGGPPGA